MESPGVLPGHRVTGAPGRLVGGVAGGRGGSSPGQGFWKAAAVEGESEASSSPMASPITPPMASPLSPSPCSPRRRRVHPARHPVHRSTLHRHHYTLPHLLHLPPAAKVYGSGARHLPSLLVPQPRIFEALLTLLAFHCSPSWCLATCHLSGPHLSKLTLRAGFAPASRRLGRGCACDASPPEWEKDTDS